MAGVGSLTELKERVFALESADATILDGDKGEIIVQDGEWLLDDIDLGTFN